ARLVARPLPALFGEALPRARRLGPRSFFLSHSKNRRLRGTTRWRGGRPGERRPGGRSPARFISPSQTGPHGPAPRSPAARTPARRGQRSSVPVVGHAPANGFRTTGSYSYSRSYS